MDIVKPKKVAKAAPKKDFRSFLNRQKVMAKNDNEGTVADVQVLAGGTV